MCSFWPSSLIVDGVTRQHDDSNGNALRVNIPHHQLTEILRFQAFTKRVKSEFSGIPNVEIIVRDEGQLPLFLLQNLTVWPRFQQLYLIVWAAEMGMVRTMNGDGLHIYYIVL